MILKQSRRPWLSSLAVSLALFLASHSSFAGFIARAFDWDDNLAFMVTPIVIFHKQTGAEKFISTAEFAVAREKVGTEEPYLEYEYRREPSKGSFRFFNYTPNGNWFLVHFQEAIKGATPEKPWKGPFWEILQRQLKTPDGAKRTSFITARGHSPQNIYDGLASVKDSENLAYLPEVKKIHPITYEAVLSGKPSNPAAPSAEKAAIMIKELDGYQLETAATGPTEISIWEFSDDDYGNIDGAISILSKQVKKGRWKQMQVLLQFTGTNNAKIKPHTIWIRPDGKVVHFKGVLTAEDCMKDPINIGTCDPTVKKP